MCQGDTYNIIQYPVDVSPLLYRASNYEFARFGQPQIKRQHNVFPICLSPAAPNWASTSDTAKIVNYFYKLLKR